MRVRALIDGVWQIESMGAGVQSTCMALLSAKGILPKLDFAIFSDTGWEPQEVYDHLDDLTRYLAEYDIPVHKASRGRIQDDVLDRRKFATLPAWTSGGGRIKRQCTPKYKVEPLERKMRELLGAPVTMQPCKYCDATGQRVAPWDEDAGLGPCSVCGGTGQRRRVGPVPKGTRVEQWIGFSTDEYERATDLGFPSWSKPRYPLLDLGWSRTKCIEWMAEQGWSGVRKSSCLGCPFHDDETWLDIANDEPIVFSELVAFDAKFRLAPGLNEQRFLHERRLPLDQAVEKFRQFKVETGEQGVLWEEFKIKRKQRHCNPFGCRMVEMDDPVPVVEEDAA